jgi:hypothetical protein
MREAKALQVQLNESLDSALQEIDRLYCFLQSVRICYVCYSPVGMVMTCGRASLPPSWQRSGRLLTYGDDLENGNRLLGDGEAGDARTDAQVRCRWSRALFP